MTLIEYANEKGKETGEIYLLARVGGKLCELTDSPLCEGTELVGIGDAAGAMAYERSAVFMFVLALMEEAGRESIDRVCVEFSMGDGLYITARGSGAADCDMAARMEARMRHMAEADIPFKKETVSTARAREIFKAAGMDDKARTLWYRRASRTNIYRLGDGTDYFYGYMAPSTGFIQDFHVRKYHDGFLLLLPNSRKATAPDVIPDMEKLFSVIDAGAAWMRHMGIEDVGLLNDRISAGGMDDIIMSSEAYMEKKIGDIADEIAGNPDRRIVLIAGPSSSGKTTFSHRLSLQLMARGLKPHPIAADNFYKNRADCPRDEKGEYDFECLEAMDTDLFSRTLAGLIAGKEMPMPVFDFKTGEKYYPGTLAAGENDVLVVEGIHCLNEAFSAGIPREKKFKIYISALTSLNIDSHNRITTSDARLLRRIVRDDRTRATPAADTIKRWQSVRKGEEKYIFPYQEDADAMLNSALPYELPALKLYAEPLLFGVKEDSREFDEAARLLKLLDYFLAIDPWQIPQNSIIREFIGRSYFDVG